MSRPLGEDTGNMVEAQQQHAQLHTINPGSQ